MKLDELKEKIGNAGLLFSETDNHPDDIVLLCWSCDGGCQTNCSSGCATGCTSYSSYA